MYYGTLESRLSWLTFLREIADNSIVWFSTDFYSYLGLYLWRW